MAVDESKRPRAERPARCARCSRLREIGKEQRRRTVKSGRGQSMVRGKRECKTMSRGAEKRMNGREREKKGGKRKKFFLFVHACSQGLAERGASCWHGRRCGQCGPFCQRRGDDDRAAWAARGREGEARWRGCQCQQASKQARKKQSQAQPWPGLTSWWSGLHGA